MPGPERAVRCVEDGREVDVDVVGSEGAPCRATGGEGVVARA